MKKTLIVTLLVEIDELTGENREHHVENGGDPGDSVENLDPHELAGLIAETVAELPEMFDGILMPCQITNVVVVDCGFELPQAA